MTVQPYIIGQWVRGNKFYGRSGLIDEILRGHRNWMWLLGTRRIGKTSLLKQIEFLALQSPDFGFFPLFWDFQGAEDPDELHMGFNDALHDASKKLGELNIDAASIEGGDLFQSLSQLRRQLQSKDLRLLLLCDEVEELNHLHQRQPSLLRKLRRAMQSSESMRSVLASTIRLWKLADQRGETSPFLHGFTPPLYINRLSNSEALALVRQANLPLDSRPDLNEEAAKSICAHCDNHPFLIQMVCRKYVESGDLEEAIEQVAADPMVSYFFSVDCEMLSQLERRIVSDIAERDSSTSDTIQRDHGADPQALVGALHRLEGLGYICRDEHKRFVLSNFFFKRWFKSNRPTNPGVEAPTTGDADRGNHARLQELFLQAQGLEGADRQRFLDQTCSDDPVLRKELEAMLDVERGGVGPLGRAWTVSPTEPGQDATLALKRQRYDILQEVGRGATGVVYRAYDRVLGLDIALKMLRPEIAREPDVLDRFRKEIVLTLDVNHPNILRIYHLDEIDGQACLTMKWIDGRSLAEELKEVGSLPVDRVITVARKLASALAALHEKGVLHRDIKPHNILVDRTGEPYLTDFGLVRLMGDPSRTRRGVFVGTPAYASPEQARLEPLDERSDIYSLGLVIYESIVGLRTNTQLGADLPDPRTVRPEAPPALTDAVLRCLHERPAERFRSASELHAALREV